MFIRSITSRNSTCFQIGKKHRGRFVLLQHVGCAIETSQIEALRVRAQQLLHTLKYKNQPSLFPITSPSTATLTDWHITGYHRVFGSAYDSIGFPNTIFRDLVVGRIVYPKSKAATLRYLRQQLGIDLSKDRVYRFMDTLSKDELTRIAYEFVQSNHSKGITVCFYDVTTLSFATDTEDSLRSKGYSKDHRHDMPQILIGLFVDHRGYPFGFDVFSGKTYEGHTFTKAVDQLIHTYHFKQLTIVADSGMLSNDNICYLINKKINYIVGARIRNLTKKLTDNVTNHDYSEQPILKVSLPNQSLIIEHSPLRARKDKHRREKVIAKLQERIEKGHTVIRKSKYVQVSDKNKVMGIDTKKIQEDICFDGLKGYVTNTENKISNREIISQYHNLWKVEKAFRMSKKDLSERPIYHQKEKRVKAHILICFVSLLVMKEAETKLATIKCSLNTAIEVLARVGTGMVKVGNVQLETESELNEETRMILELFEGH